GDQEWPRPAHTPCPHSSTTSSARKPDQRGHRVPTFGTVLHSLRAPPVHGSPGRLWTPAAAGEFGSSPGRRAARLRCFLRKVRRTRHAGSSRAPLLARGLSILYGRR